MNSGESDQSEEEFVSEEEEDEDQESFYVSSENENDINETKEIKQFPPKFLEFSDDFFDRLYKIDEHHGTMMGIWKEYGVDPEATLDVFTGRGIDELFLTPNSQLDILAPIERRIQIEGQKFKVVENDKCEETLRRALARAITGSESNYTLMRQEILSELMNNWMNYCMDMGEECGFHIINLPSLDKPEDLLARYKEYYLTATYQSPIFHLVAAANRFGFNFVVFDANNYDGRVRVHNSSRWITKKTPTMIYHFLRTGSIRDSWSYEFIIPIGQPIIPYDGVYPIIIYDVLLVDSQSRNYLNKKRSSENTAQLYRKPQMGFALDHRIFLYKPTYSHDLWSILSEMLTRKLINAPKIMEACYRTRINESKYYHWSKLKKRRLIKGYRKEDKLCQQYTNSFRIPYGHRGNVEDLEHAASYFNFSFVLIGLDSNGNFFWKETIASPSDMQKISEKYAFFVTYTKSRKTYWHALEDADWNLPKVQEIYKNTTFLDDTFGMRSLYCRTVPCLNVSKIPSNYQAIRSSRWSLLMSQINLGRKFFSKGTSSLVSPIDSIVQPVSLASTNVFNRLTSWFKSFRFPFRNRRIGPHEDEQTLKRLYLRDNP